MPDPIDLERLRQFSEGTPDGLRRLADLFLDHLQATSEELRAAMTAQDRAAVRSLAHRAAGAAGACGAALLAALLERLQRLGPEERVERMLALMDCADAELARVRGFLQQYVEQEQ
jgi:HPt (histidine-containing phosphotransfer) domain-containing protein